MFRCCSLEPKQGRIYLWEGISSLQGCFITSVSKRVTTASDQPPLCFKKTFKKDSKTKIDYFSCSDCKKNCTWQMVKPTRFYNRKRHTPYHCSYHYSTFTMQAHSSLLGLSLSLSSLYSFFFTLSSLYLLYSVSSLSLCLSPLCLSLFLVSFSLPPPLYTHGLWVCL